MDKNNNNPAILVVDDKEENLLAMQQALASLHASVFVARSGQEALSLSLTRPFAVILLDVQMPDMDGFETAELLRANHETASIPIIFVTAVQSQEHYTDKAYKIGVVDYLYKPVNKVVLCSKVKTFLLLEKQRCQLSSLSESLREANERQTLLLENAGEGIVGISATGLITFVNSEACKLLEQKELQLVHKSVQQVFSNTAICEQLVLWQQAKNDNVMAPLNQQRIRLKKVSGQKMPIEFSMSPLTGACHQFRGCVLLFQDITKREQQEEKLLYEAHHDSLTGLANRLLLKEFLNASIARNQRQKKYTGLLFLDLDKFKQVNDSLGHEMGDALLNHAADRLKQCVRGSDLIARQGGDEFVIVLDEITTQQNVSVIAEKITQALVKPFDLNGQSITIGVSIGIALWPKDGLTPDMMIKAADLAMYQAKQQGGNCYCFYDCHSMQ